MAIKTILCIEDDRFIGEMYVRSLNKAGYEVDWMVDGNDGLVAARNKPYDLILLDIMLPERRGSEILEVLRGGKTEPAEKKGDRNEVEKSVHRTNLRRKALRMTRIEEEDIAIAATSGVT